MKDLVKYIKKEEIYKFQDLIKKNWDNQNHIFTKNKKLIEFYYNFYNKKLTNILGLYRGSKLVASLGLIPGSNWDSKLQQDYFLAFLIKSKFTKDASFKFFQYIFKKIKLNFLCVSGINMNTIGKFYKKIANIQTFEHYYIYNGKIKNKISKNLIEKKKNIENKLNIKIDKKINDLPFSNYYPKKTIKYFNNKYLNNPFYDYFVIKFYNKKKLVFFFICRKISVKNNSIIRIVDFYGKISPKTNILYLIKDYLYINKIEYIDFLCFGFEKGLLEKIGFNKKKKNQTIPNYFEPFVRKNINLNFSILINKYKKTKIVLFKGDGDQDRRNI